jgi:hypothetical protein
MGVENLALVTGRLFWQPPDNLGYLALGNVTEFKEEPDRQRVPHMAFENGVKREDFELVKTTKERFTFTMDEHFDTAIALLNLGSQAADTVQAAAVGVAAAILTANLVLGRTYDFGKQSVKNVVGTANALPLVENTDYTIDKGAGLLTIISNAQFGHDWNFVFDCDQVTKMNFTGLSGLLSQGTFKYFAVDQTDVVPRDARTLSGQVYVSNWGDNNAEDFNKYVLEILYQPQK